MVSRTSPMRIREERPTAFASLRTILDVFQAKSSGDAFFPAGGSDGLNDALAFAGWRTT